MPKTQNQHSCPYCNATSEANGTIIHQSIYCFMNNPSVNKSIDIITNQQEKSVNNNTDDITTDNTSTTDDYNPLKKST